MKIVLLEDNHGIPKGTELEGTICNAGIYLGDNRFVHIQNVSDLEWEGKAPREMSPYELGEFMKYRAAGLPYYCDGRRYQKCVGSPWAYLCPEAVYTSCARDIKKITEIRKEMERLALELKKLENNS